ncbi:MAG: TonB-dependent receptor [Planctomycetes bacterium]|nr:TonB-dependent receptor [Planctomycetota bacterium]
MLSIGLAAPAFGQGEGPSQDLRDYTLEQILDMEVSIASPSDQKQGDAPAAVYVLTGDEIRRAGFTTIQEALRMVPGFFVARYTSTLWQVTARGFSGSFASDLLVMIDGVSVYTPLFAGVWWELQAIDMDDVERIEIVRGPGASLWGANAVNGVINVITKHSKDTHGVRVTALAGNESRELAARWGGKLDEDVDYRAWFKGSENSPLVDSLGDPANEHWTIGKVGFRTDWTRANGDRVKFLGNGYVAGVQESYAVAFPTAPFSRIANDTTPKNGGFLLGSWERDDTPDSNMKLSAWWSKDFQKQVDFRMNIDVFDVEFRRSRNLAADNTLTWGVGYHVVNSHLPSDFTYTFDPISRVQQTPRVFLHDEIRFPEQNASVTLAAQVEHTSFTGFEVQPSIRALWHPRENHTVWAALSRAVRTPSIEENDIAFRLPYDNFSGDFFLEQGSSRYESEKVVAAETGWRWSPSPTLSLDVSAFYNHYDDKRTLEFGTPFNSGGLQFFPFTFDNKAQARSYGVEVACDWDVSDRWRIRSGYSLFKLHTTLDADSNDFFLPTTDHSTPKNQINVRSYYDLGEHWEFDVGAYYVDDVLSYDNPAYTRVDARLGWNPNPNVRFSLGVQNAFMDQHPETGEDLIGIGTEVERNVYFSVSWSH